MKKTSVGVRGGWAGNVPPLTFLPSSIHSSTMVDTCVLSVLTLLLFTSLTGRKRGQRCCGAGQPLSPHLSPKNRSLPFSPAPPLIVWASPKHKGGCSEKGEREERRRERVALAHSSLSAPIRGFKMRSKKLLIGGWLFNTCLELLGGESIFSIFPPSFLS